MPKDSRVQRDTEQETEAESAAAEGGEGAGSGEAIGAADDDGGIDVRERAAGTASAGELQQLQREVEEQRDKYLRLAADFDNYRKRSRRDLDEARTRSQAELVKQLLEALDDMSRVTSFDPSATEAKAVIEGVELVERKLMKALTSAGLEIINPVDEPFNPELHEAVSTTPALSREDDSMIAVVYQPGFTFKGQLLRAARVVVKQWNG